MKSIIITLIMSGIISHSYSQYNAKVSTCQAELSALQSKRAAIDAEYDRIVNDLRSGLFCSQCNRSKTEIEKGGEGFSQHLKSVKGNVVEAPPKAYEQAHKNYLQKFNQWKESVNSKEQACNNLQKDAQNEYTKQVQQTTQNNYLKQQQAQEQAQEHANLAQQQLQQQLQQQQADANAAMLQQQQDFAQTVNNYSAMQNQENQQRKQDLDNLANKGKDLGKTIQGNAPDINKIAGQNWNDQSVFGSVPSYEDILKSTSANSEESRFQQLKAKLSDIGSNFKDNITNRWEKIKEIVPGCVKCVWNSEPIRDYVKDAIAEKFEWDPWEFAKEATETRFPRISNFIGSVGNVMPVYDIGTSANDLMEQTFTSFNKVMEGADTDEEIGNIENGIENLKHTIYGSLPGISGKLYNANRALRSLFDCKPKN